MKTSAQFPSRWLPLAFAGPQLLIVGLFFYAPVVQALSWSFTLEKPFGGETVWVGMENYARLLSDESFWRSCATTLLFTLGGCGGALVGALVLAFLADRPLRGRRLFANLLVWPLAVAPPLLAMVLRLVANPVVGPLAVLNEIWPGLWQPGVNGAEALCLVTAAFAWTILPFDFVVLLAGLQSVPETYLQAAALDGAGPIRRFIDIQLPLLKPFIVFVVTMNAIEAITHSFGLIHTLTEGGPDGATTTLVYKAYVDGSLGLDLSGSAAVSVVLVAVIVGLVALKSRFAPRAAAFGR